MIHCIGYPYCKTFIEDDMIACKKCWRRISPRTLKNELKAVNRNFKGTKLYHQVYNQAVAIVHRKLARKAKHDSYVFVK